MTYFESAAGERVTRDRARREIASHGCDWAEFIEDCGERPTYDAQAVLRWLGY